MNFSPDLSLRVLSDGFDAQGDSTGGSCGADDPTLVPNERQGSRNLFLHSSIGGAYQLVDVAPLGVGPSNSEFQAGSSDFSHVVFEDEAALTPGAASGINIYEWAGGSVHLVSVLPDGTPVSGTVANPAEYAGPGATGIGPGSFGGNAPFTGAVSSDGSRVFFQANGNLYVRENPTQPQSAISAGVCTDAADACTVQVDASQSGGSGGGGSFQWASSDGSLVFFTDDASAGVTGDTVSGSGQNLYQYDVSTGELTDLTPATSAAVQGLAGSSSDGAYVYFVADGVLASGAASDQPNLYLYHAGKTTFVAKLNASSDSGDWNVSGFLTANVSPSGRYIAFNSVNSLTGDDNVEQSTSQPDTEIYRYDATTGKLSCASCDPSGAPPIGPAALPGREQMANTPAAGYLQRNLSADGRVFFDSPDPLVANASNGQSNVYESEPDGVGGCAQANGCLYLISSGTSAAGSFFYDASTSGDDVFFVTDQNLVGDGTDNSGMSIYDARVGGGFAPPAQAAPSCTEGTCQAAVPSLPQAPTAATVAFTGPGNAIANASPTTGKVKVLHRVVQGRSFMLTVSVPAKGHLTISGKDVVRVSRSVAHAGRYRIKVRLNATGKRRLKRRRTLKVDLRVRYRSNDGRASAASVSLTAKARRAR